MFFLGALAILQITIIPGALFLKLINFKGGMIQRLAFTFGSSLIINYCVVFLLASLGFYRQEVMLALFVIECIALGWLYRSALFSPLGPAVVRLWHSFSMTIQGLVPSRHGMVDDGNTALGVLSAVVTLIFAVLAIVCIWWVVRLFIFNIGTVFNSWDSLVSWNRWAVEWANNQVPTRTWRYPQLIPTNWSLTYVFNNDTTVQFFAKALHPVFALFILLLMFDLGLDAKTAGYFIGVVLTYLMLKKFQIEGITNGYIDVPVAFSSFLVIYTLLKASSAQDERSRRQAIILSNVYAAGAAVTKQVGVYILGVTPLLVFFILIRPFYKPIPRETWKLFLISLAVAAIIAVPWYLYKQVAFIQGFDTTETEAILQYTSNAHENMGPFESLLDALLSLEKYAWLLAFLVPALFVVAPAHRWITALIIFPFTLIWAGVASYNTRNLTLVFPLLGMVTGMGLQQFFHLGLRLLGRLKIERWKMIILPALLLAALIAGNFLLPTSLLHGRQIALQKQILSPTKNEKLYAFFEQVGPDVMILTNYPIRLLPGLENNQISFNFSDYDIFLQKVSDPSIEYMFVPNKADRQILEYIEQKIANGDYELVFEDNKWITYRLIRILRR